MKRASDIPSEIPVILFPTPADWETWLAEHHADSRGLWLRIAKKDGELTSVTYPEALDVALCHGWIDGQKKSYDDHSWLQKFTPRGARSIWSKINREKVQALIDAGRMRPSGLKEIERARKDGRWDAAYDSQSNATVPEDFQAELDRSPRAGEFFATLKGANRYAILFRIHTAKKAETRARRIREFIEMLERHETLHPATRPRKTSTEPSAETSEKPSNRSSRKSPTASSGKSSSESSKASSRKPPGKSPGKS